MSVEPSDGLGSLPVEAGIVPRPWHGVPAPTARRFHQVCWARTAEVLREFGLTPLQYSPMVYLSQTTGCPDIEQNVLAERLNVDRNTASLLVKQLATMGLVTQKADRADRRIRRLRLTPKGEKLYQRIRSAYMAANEEILAPLTPRERKLLMSLLVRVIEQNMPLQKRDSRQLKRRSPQIPISKI